MFSPPRMIIWYASDFAPHFAGLISPHLGACRVHPGASDERLSVQRQRYRPEGSARQAVPLAEREVRDLDQPDPRRVHDRAGSRPVGRGPLDDHEAAHGGAPGRAGRVGVLQAGGAVGQRPGPGAGGRSGRDRAADGGAQGNGRAVDAGRGKRALGLSGRVPRRVPAATKHELLELIDAAVADGWDHRRVCAYLELAEGRAWRWRERRLAGTLEDSGAGRASGARHHFRGGGGDPGGVRGPPRHRSFASQARGPRLLRGRGVGLGVDRAAGAGRSPAADPLAAAGRTLGALAVSGVASYERHSIWIYDTTRFARCRSTYAVMIMDLVTRKWITEVVSAEQTGLQ